MRICYNVKNHIINNVGYYAIKQEARIMNRKLGRLLNPGLGLYFWVMLSFCLASLLFGLYPLAAVEGIIILLLFGSYTIFRKARSRQLLRFLQDSPNTLESISRGESPFPAVVICLADGGIVWSNEQFDTMTGFSDAMAEHQLDDVIPDFKTDWLIDRKTEAPYDVTVGGRRYRVYGTTTRSDDPMGIMLGVLYFSDLTKLYQIRDEYVRSRPVVSIILIDNYEELTKNLTENSISAMHAKLGDTITRSASPSGAKSFSVYL